MEKISSQHIVEPERKAKRELSKVIEEMDMAYRSLASQNGSMNIDYAGFACMAIGSFRDALQDQNLSCDDLQAMLRAGQKEHREEGKDSDWSSFVASHVRRTANENANS